MQITTPEQLEQFKEHKIGTESVVVHIESTAHPDVLAQAKHFDNFQNAEIHFKAADGNTIEISPRYHRVNAHFTNGINLMAQYLPQNYKEYEIRYERQADLTAADLDALYTCSNAEKVSLSDAFHVDGDLEYRVDGLKHMTKLHTLSVNIAMPRYPTVQMTPFLVNAPALKIVEIVMPSSMTWNQQKLFANSQQVPQQWRMDYNRPVLHFHKSA